MAKTPKDQAVNDNLIAELRSGTELTISFRHWLNHCAPCAIMALDASKTGFKARVFLEPPEPDVIRIDLTGGGKAITAANAAAALGNSNVAGAAAALIDVAAGRSAGNIVSLCSQITDVLFGQVDRYPLNRPDLRWDCERAPMN